MRPRPAAAATLGAWLLLALAALALAATACRARPLVDRQPGKAAITIAGERFVLEVAADPATRWAGLSDREAIAADGGMLFVYPEAAERSFVMRRCLVPIDIAFLDEEGRVVAWHAMAVEPPGTPDAALARYRSGAPARYVIEVRGGTLGRLGLAVGDTVELPRITASR